MSCVLQIAAISNAQITQCTTMYNYVTDQVLIVIEDGESSRAI